MSAYKVPLRDIRFVMDDLLGFSEHYKQLKIETEIDDASVDFLMFSGYTLLAYFWARMAQISLEKLQSGTDAKELYLSKVSTARFYFQRILPFTSTLKLTIQSGAKNRMQINSEQF